MIELIVVVAILGIIAAVVSPLFGKSAMNTACETRGMDYSPLHSVCIAADGSMHDPILFSESSTVSTVPTPIDAAELLCGSGGWVGIEKGSYSTIYTCADGRQIKVDL